MGSIDLAYTAKSSQTSIFRMKIIVGCLVVVLSVYLEAALVDVNKDGVYDRNEFHWAFPNADLYQEFDRVDANKDGLITSEEIEPAAISRTVTGAFGKAVESRTSIVHINLRNCRADPLCPRCERAGINQWICY